MITSYLRAYLRAFRLGAIQTAANRRALFMRSVFYLMVATVLSGLWRVSIAANGGELAGYHIASITWYIIVAEVAVISVPNNMLELVSQDISNEQVVTELLRPADPHWLRIARTIGQATPTIITLGAAGLTLGFALEGPPSITAIAVIPSLALSVMLAVLVHHLLAAFTFWLGDVTALWIVYQKVVFLLGGLVLPLEVLPTMVEQVARLAPPMAMVYAPARLASGASPSLEWTLLATQAGWTFTAFVGVHYLYTRGIRRALAGSDPS